MKKALIIIVNSRGLHARASAKIANIANQFSSAISLTTPQKTADGKSIMQIMMLAASCGSELTLEVEGEDESQAILAIQELIARGFDEID